jgi:hypothetical protein
MTTEISTMLALIAAVGLVIAGVGFWWINREPRQRRDHDEELPLFTGLGSSSADVTQAAHRGRAPRSPQATGTAAPMRAQPTSEAAAAVEPPPALRPESRPIIREFTTAPLPPAVRHGSMTPPSVVQVLPARPAPPSAHVPVVSKAGVPGTMVEGHAIRFSVPAEGTLQFLPGRLEIGSGLDAGREIRFVNVPGPEGTDVTFGRIEGALYRHVQLRDKTVSRQHAEMQWRGGHWYLRNLSQTNPVARNGAVLDTVDAPCLQDGDRIEMGEVLFTFRSR